MGFFGNITKDMSKLEQDYLGPDYPYYKKINSPSHLGMSGHGSISALSSDIAGIVDYVEILVSGSGKASKTGNPLGDKFFLKTGGQCKDYLTNKLVTRSMYINNVPTSNIPIISNLSGMSFPEFRGLAPAVVQDLWAINPVKMFRAFMEGNEPLCAEVKLETIDVNDKKQQESGYVPIIELNDLISDSKIPKDTVTSKMKDALNNSSNNKNSNNSKESFMNMCNIISGNDVPKQNNKKYFKDLDPLSNIYFISLAIGMLYLVYKLTKK